MKAAGAAGAAGAPARQPRSPPIAAIDGHPLTPEQMGVLASGANRIKVQAYAGTGKTTLLRAFAQQTHDARGLYLAFNTSIAAQGRALFPDHVHCRTHNATALRELGLLHPGWRSISPAKLDTPRAEHVAALLPDARVSPAWVLATIQSYIYSRDPAIHPGHFPMSRAMFMRAGHGAPDAEAHAAAARSVWDAMRDPHSAMPMPHDGCLKLWSLSPRQLPYDYLLIDESQDSNPAFLQAIEQQKCRLVYVGDEHQGIYGFRGAINALAHVAGCDERRLTETHRFGPRLSLLANEVIRSKRAPALITSSPTAPDTEVVVGRAPLGSQPLFLARTNAGLFEQALSFSKQGKRFALVGDAKKFTFPDLHDLLELREKTGKGAYAAHHDLEQLRLAAEADGRGDLAMRARIAQKHGPKLPSMLAAINQQLGAQALEGLAPETARLSTLHQAKGLESDWVELLGDFMFAPGSTPRSRSAPTQPGETNGNEEANVLYVAITRARKGLAIRSKEVGSWAQSIMDLSPIRPSDANDDALFG